jgi:hypothetical protein
MGFMMKMLVSLLACICLGATTSSVHAAFASGQDLLDGFTAFTRIGTASAKPTDPSQAARVAGYVQGTIDSAISAGIFCIKGKNLTLRNAEPLITQYILSNPSMLKKPAVEAVVMALHPTYKCD